MPHAPDRKRILVVEDDDAIRESMTDALEMEGYEAIPAENGREALDRLSERGDVSLILLDLFMPVMDGIQFLASLESGVPEGAAGCPVIIVSAAPPEGDVASSVSKRALDFIRKPVDLDRLFRAIRQHC